MPPAAGENPPPLGIGPARTWVALLRAWQRRARTCLPGYLLAPVLAFATCGARAQPLARPAPAAVSLEYAVKATYLYKLAPFVNWPPDEFTSATEPFRICVAGEDPFDDYLTRAVAGRSFGTHPFEVRQVDALTPDVQCQIVFISHLASQTIAQALAAVDGKPMLTVIDSAARDRAGIVQFVMDQGRVRFEINTGAAARHHITISSKLLNLALAVRNAP